MAGAGSSCSELMISTSTAAHSTTISLSASRTPSAGLRTITIRVGNERVAVSDVDYDTDVLTVSASISWAADAPVSLDYAGLKPDVGCFEFDTSASVRSDRAAPRPSLPGRLGTVRVFSIQGRLVPRLPDGGRGLRVPGTADGVYLVEVRSGNRSGHTKFSVCR